MMTPERIAELRALADAATPGPWTNDDIDFTYQIEITGVVTADMAFCLAARTALPEALDAIERVWQPCNDPTANIMERSYPAAVLVHRVLAALSGSVNG